MTDTDDALNAIERATTELLRQLREPLVRHGLGEIAVRIGELRMRVAGAPSTVTNQPAAEPDAANASGQPADPAVTQGAGTPERATAGQGVSSPAVGYFVYSDGLGPG